MHRARRKPQVLQTEVLVASKMCGSCWTATGRCRIIVAVLAVVAMAPMLDTKYCGERTVNTPYAQQKTSVLGDDICGWLEAEHMHMARSKHSPAAPSTHAWLPNVVFVKGVKVGGTTAAGVTHQIGRNYGMVNLCV